MKKIFGVFAAVVTNLSMAVSPVLPGGVPQIAPEMQFLSVASVDDRGSILKPFVVGGNQIVVGVPIRVQLPNSCVSFAGFQSVSQPGPGGFPTSIELNLLGAADPLAGACLQVIGFAETVLPIAIPVNPYQPVIFAQRIVNIAGAPYIVRIELTSNEVTIHPLRRIGG